jgi:hypothetical protein
MGKSWNPLRHESKRTGDAQWRSYGDSEPAGAMRAHTTNGIGSVSREPVIEGVSGLNLNESVTPFRSNMVLFQTGNDLQKACQSSFQPVKTELDHQS